MTLTIPTPDLTEFMLLPADVRQDVERWQQSLSAITPPITRALRTVAHQSGTSYQTALRKYYDWRRGGWRALVNRAKVPDGRGLDAELIEYWKSLCEQNGRKCRPAYRELVRRYRGGAPIPGVEPGASRQCLPIGWTYRNLARHKPTKLELNAARIGRAAAQRYLPKPFTTRVGLRVGQRYIFDDLWHDFEVVMLGRPGAMRLLQLHAHDLLSGCQFARGLKPRVKNEDGTSVGLNQSEMLFLVAHVLSEFGWDADGCVMMVEHGTAAIRDDLEQRLFDLTSGKVIVERSGIDGASAFAGQYAGRSKGNFRFKAALESLGNLIHNETASLIDFPGQTGSNARLNLPEELHGRERHFDCLALAMAALPSQIAHALRLPFLEVNQARWLVEEVMERINRRTEHELEGWLEAGFTAIDFDMPGIGLMPAQQFLALPPEKQAAVRAVGSPVVRKLSPREVFDAGRKHLVRLRPEQSALLLKDTQGREVAVGHDHLITFEDVNIAPGPLRYLAHHFAPGDKFLAVLNPWSLDALHLFDARGAWVGQVRAWQTVSRIDEDALHAQMGRAAKVEKELLAPLARRGAALTRKRIEDAQHNAQVIRTAGQSVSDVMRVAGDASELLTGPEEASEVVTERLDDAGFEASQLL